MNGDKAVITGAPGHAGSFRIADYVRSVSDPDGTILMNTQNDAIMSLNPTATIIWQSLSRGADIQGVIDELKQTTDGYGEELADDVNKFIRYAVTSGLLYPQP